MPELITKVSPLVTPAVKPPVTPAPVAAPAATKFNFPLPMVAICGESSTGKSTSYANMDWDRTAVIDTELKGFPFDHTRIKHYVPCRSHTAVEDAIARYKSGHVPGIRYVIIDSSLMYMDLLLDYCKSVTKGFDIYAQFNNGVKSFLKSLKNEKVIFIVIAAPELVSITDDAGKTVNARRMFTYGQQLQAKLEYEFLVVLFTAVRKVNDKITYNFLTNTDGICSAKSPAGMFDTALIPNDLALALKRIDPAEKNKQ